MRSLKGCEKVMNAIMQSYIGNIRLEDVNEDMEITELVDKANFAQNKGTGY